MKLITALVRPTAFKRLSTALRKARVSGITVAHVEGFGKEHLDADMDLFGHLNPKTKVEIAVEESKVDEVVEIIQSSVSSKSNDSGATVFVLPIDKMIKIPKS